MPAGGLERPLAEVLSRLSVQARGRVLQMLPPSLHEQVVVEMEAPGGPDGTEPPLVAQILAQELDRLLAGPDLDDTFTEAVQLKAADVLAVVFLHASTDEVAATLPHLPQTLQNEILHKIAAQDWDALARRVGHGEAAFVAELDLAWGQAARRTDPDFAADALRHVSSANQVRRTLSAIHQLDPGTSKQIQRRLFTLEDLDGLTDREIQVYVRGVDDWDLAIAMSTLPRRLRGRILSNVSRRRARSLVEDEKHLSNTDEEDVANVRIRMLARAQELFEAGRIHTYLGSVGVVEQEESGEDDGAEEEERPPPRRVAVRRRRVGVSWGQVGAGVGVGVLTVPIILWLSGIRRGSTPKGRGGGSVTVEDYARRTRSSNAAGDPSPSSAIGATRSVRTAKGASSAHEGDALIFPGRGQAPDVEALSPGDTLSTPQDGQAVVRLWDESGQLQADPESQVQLGDPGQTTDEPPRVRIRVGNVWMYVRNPALEVHSPVARVTASEGALYRVRVVLSAATEVSVSKGTVWVHPKFAKIDAPAVLGPGESVRVEPRGRLTIQRGGQADSTGWLGLF